MQDCPYAEGGMATAAGGFNLGSLVPEMPGTALIKQILDPWNWMNVASMLMSAVNLLLYLRLQTIAAAGSTNVDVQVQNMPVTEVPRTPAVELRAIPGRHAPLPLDFEGRAGASFLSFSNA